MATGREAPQIPPLAETRWLWVARVATFLWLLVLIALLVAGAPQGLVVFAIALAGILAGLFRKAPRRALAWAFGAGSVMFVGAAVVAVAGALETKGGRWWLIPVSVLFVATQAVLPASALKAFYALGRQKDHLWTLTKGILGPAILLAIISMSPGLSDSFRANRGVPPNQAWAVGSLRTINTAEITYASTYVTGFSPSLAALAPPADNEQPTASAAGLVDSVLAGGIKRGYTFAYTPGPKDASGNINTYTVVARPVEYGKSGRMSYFTDESGVVRVTGEDRPATVKDPERGRVRR